MVQQKTHSCTAQQELKQKTLLTRKDVAALLSISLPTLHSYTKQGILKAHVLGNIIRYKYDEVIEAFRLMKGGQIA